MPTGSKASTEMAKKISKAKSNKTGTKNKIVKNDDSSTSLQNNGINTCLDSSKTTDMFPLHNNNQIHPKYIFQRGRGQKDGCSNEPK